FRRVLFRSVRSAASVGSTISPYAPRQQAMWHAAAASASSTRAALIVGDGSVCMIPWLCSMHPMSLFAGTLVEHATRQWAGMGEAANGGQEHQVDRHTHPPVRRDGGVPWRCHAAAAKLRRTRNRGVHDHRG